MTKKRFFFFSGNTYEKPINGVDRRNQYDALLLQQAASHLVYKLEDVQRNQFMPATQANLQRLLRRLLTLPEVIN